MGPKTRRSKTGTEKKEEMDESPQKSSGSQDKNLTGVKTRSGRAIRTPQKIADMSLLRKTPPRVTEPQASRKTPPRVAEPQTSRKHSPRVAAPQTSQRSRTPPRKEQVSRRTPHKRGAESSKGNLPQGKNPKADEISMNQQKTEKSVEEEQQCVVEESHEMVPEVSLDTHQLEIQCQQQSTDDPQDQQVQPPDQQSKESQDQQLQIEVADTIMDSSQDVDLSHNNQVESSIESSNVQLPNVESQPETHNDETHPETQNVECKPETDNIESGIPVESQPETHHVEAQPQTHVESQPYVEEQQQSEVESQNQQVHVVIQEELQNEQLTQDESENQQQVSQDESENQQQVSQDESENQQVSQDESQNELVIHDESQQAPTDSENHYQPQMEMQQDETESPTNHQSEELHQQEQANFESQKLSQLEFEVCQAVAATHEAQQVASSKEACSQDQLQQQDPPHSMTCESIPDDGHEAIIVVSMEVDEHGNQIVRTTPGKNQSTSVAEMQQMITTVAAEVASSSQSDHMGYTSEIKPVSIAEVTEITEPMTTESQGPSPPSGIPPSSVGYPEAPSTPSIVIKTFDNQYSLLSALSNQAGTQYVSFDQQSLMSSTIGGSTHRKCGICGKVYRNRNGLYKHRLAKHPHLVNANKPIHCQQPGCQFDCHRLENLREHITEEHKIPMMIERGNFASMAEFIQWKERLEKENCANFVKTRGASGNTLGVHTKHRYYCSRSGFHNSKSTGKRRKVTTKIGAYCTAGINVLEHKSTGAIQAEACITHHGHPIQLEYLKIPSKDKREIANQMVKGKKWEHILQEYHESGLRQGTRSSILSKKDLMNIQRIAKPPVPDPELASTIDFDQQVEIDGSDFNQPPSATESETEIAIESLQRLGEVVTTNLATLRDGILSDLDLVAQKVKECPDRDSLVTASNHVKAALSILKRPLVAASEVNGVGLSRTPQPGRGEQGVVIKEGVEARGDGGVGEQTIVEIAESIASVVNNTDKDTNSDVRVPTGDSQGEDDMPVYTYRLVPAAAENATCPLDSLATTSQYRTLGIRLTKEMLYTLSLICEKHQMDRLLSGGNLINREEVEIICSKIPDEVIDADMTSIRVLLERDAWYLLESAVELKRSDWKCGLCDKVTGKLHMIRCCACNNWFHWVCVEIEEQPTEEWFCPGCILRKRMQAIQTKKATRQHAIEEAAQ